MNGTPHENVEELYQLYKALEARCENVEKDLSDLRSAHNKLHVESKEKKESKRGK